MCSAKATHGYGTGTGYKQRTLKNEKEEVVVCTHRHSNGRLHHLLHPSQRQSCDEFKMDRMKRLQGSCILGIASFKPNAYPGIDASS